MEVLKMTECGSCQTRRPLSTGYCPSCGYKVCFGVFYRLTIQRSK